MNIILCGLPMCGKTTIGKMLADQLRWRFIDTDRLIEQAFLTQSGKTATCRQIYSEEGEQAFRAYERQQIATLKDVNDAVISIGGGALLDSINASTLQSLGPLIYLKADIDTLWTRRNIRGKPAYLDQNNPKESFYQMAQSRTPLYEKSAAVTIDTTGLNGQEIIAAILKKLKTQE